MENEPREKKPANQESEQQPELTVEELVEAFRDKIDPEDIPLFESDDLDEAKDRLMSILVLNGEEDPEQLLIERGIAERFYNFPEVHEIVNRPSTTGEEYSTEQADEAGRRAVETDALLPENQPGSDEPA